MKFIADLHIHSHFSRATSRTLDPEHLALWAQKKGIRVVGTGDFTHPGWIAELREKLVRAEDGLYRLKPELQAAVNRDLPPSCAGSTRFLLSGEISCIYKKDGKTRKTHHLILMPDLDTVDRLNAKLDRIGNIASDGRPILGLDSKDLLEMTLEAGDGAFFIPAHIWTPWFSVFGSKSGFDSLEACFGDLTPHIHALETGLSSDPPMNRLLSGLDRYTLVSNSDAHSPAKLGREANLFDTEPDYDHMIRAMRDGTGFGGTIEFYPEEGKYHLDGHRKCGVRLLPEQTRELGGRCPVCGRPVTVGVLSRVHALADRATPVITRDFFSLVPLPEVLAELLGCGAATKKVAALYEKILSGIGPELEILMLAPLPQIEAEGGPLLAEAVRRMREGRVIRQEGYDGEYGVIRLFDDAEKDVVSGQMALFSRERIPGARSGRRRARAGKRSVPPPDGDAVSMPPAVRPGRQGKKGPADPILDPLNPEQRSAVCHAEGHLLVVAGPGTGKTLTLTHRIAYLLRSGRAEPGRILALTFTRKAAREMAERISTLTGDGDRVHVFTFHGFCLEVLRRDGRLAGLPPDFALCPEADARHLATEVLSGGGGRISAVSGFLKALPSIKAEAVLHPEAPGASPERLALFREYQSRLRAAGMLDLDDLEVETVRLFQEHPGIAADWAGRFPWIFVDEYQDTSPVQAALLRRLVFPAGSPHEREESGPRLFVIGDPDQAIYGFRGADVASFYRFERDFPGAETVTLKRNYRSTGTILSGAAALMGGKTPLASETPGGPPIRVARCRTAAEEAEMIVEQVERLLGGTTYFSLDSGRVDSHEGELSLGFGDLGVLFRLNAQGDALEEALGRAGIPFIRSGSAPLIDRYPVNILWRFFQTLRYPGNSYYERMYRRSLKDAGRPDPGLEARRKWAGTDESDAAACSELLREAVRIHGLDDLPEDADAALQRLGELAAGFEADLSGFLDTLSLERGIDHEMLMGDRVALMSLHAAKGLEWPVVFITGCEDRLIPCSLFGDRDDMEERRLLYVGMTRARSMLILSHAARRGLNGRVLEMNPSPFLNDIPGDLLRPLDRRAWKPRKPAHRQLSLF